MAALLLPLSIVTQVCESSDEVKYKMKSDSSKPHIQASLTWLFLILAGLSLSSCSNGNSGSTLPPVDLPTFETLDELNQSRWPEYFTHVYGNSPSSESDFPIDISLFPLVYEDSLEAIDVILQ